MGLDKERRVADPGDADLAGLNFREDRRHEIARALNEERGNDDLGEVISFVPIRPRPQLYPSGTLILGAVFGRLADDVPSAFLRKRNRHLPQTI